MSQTASKESFDILVAGAGTAGVCAAIQAARAGASVCLVEKNGIPGGTITAAGIAYPGIFHAWGKQVIAGIGWGSAPGRRAAIRCRISATRISTSIGGTRFRSIRSSSRPSATKSLKRPE